MFAFYVIFIVCERLFDAFICLFTMLLRLCLKPAWWKPSWFCWFASWLLCFNRKKKLDYEERNLGV